MPPLGGRGGGEGELRSGGNVGQLLLARVDSGQEPTINHPTRSLVQVLLCKPATTHTDIHCWVIIATGRLGTFEGGKGGRGGGVYDSHGKVWGGGGGGRCMYYSKFWGLGGGGTSCDSTKVKHECHLQLLVEILLQKNVLQLLQHKRVQVSDTQPSAPLTSKEASCSLFSPRVWSLLKTWRFAVETDSESAAYVERESSYWD